jgi:phosphate transport system permease protein
MSAEPAQLRDKEFTAFLARRQQSGRVFEWAALAATGAGLVMLAVLFIDVLMDGWPWLRPQLITEFPSRFPEETGLRSALQGTIWMIAITAAVAFPVGVGAAVFLEEYARKNWFTNFLEINISNLAGVPSIIYGLLGLALFAEVLQLDRSVLTGALTMALLILPIIVVSSREAIRAVPRSLRQASLALGATQWQTIWNHVLPYAMPGILTGNILALSRAIGESAPLITIGALTYIRFDLSGPLDFFTVLPIQIFNWISLPQKEFHDIAAAGIVVLLAVLLAMNSAAILLRNRLQRKW